MVAVACRLHSRQRHVWALRSGPDSSGSGGAIAGKWREPQWGAGPPRRDAAVQRAPHTSAGCGSAGALTRGLSLAPERAVILDRNKRKRGAADERGAKQDPVRQDFSDEG